MDKETIMSNNAELAKVVRKMAAALNEARDTVRDLNDQSDKLDEAAGTMFDAAELVLCLARMLEGKDVHAAFGAPGDWGYHTAIGQTLYRLYTQPSTAHAA